MKSSRYTERSGNCVSGGTGAKKSERGGFEPPMAFDHTRLPIVHLRPLGHLSNTNREEFIGNFSPCKYSLRLFLHAEGMVFDGCERFIADGMLHSARILRRRLGVDPE